MLHTRTIEMSRLYYDEGWTMQRIAEHFNVYPSTVCTAIRRMDKRQCPVGTLCKNCKMPECIIKPKYQHIINHGEQTKRKSNEREMEVCCFCNKPCLPKEYTEVQDQEGNPKRYYFHKSCYYHNTIGYKNKRKTVR